MSKLTSNNMLDAILLWFVAIPIVVFADGLVLKHLWNWFIVPAMNAREISIPIALGLSIVSGCLVGNRKNSATESDSKLTLTLTALAIRGFFLLFGYLIHLIA